MRTSGWNDFLNEALPTFLDANAMAPCPPLSAVGPWVYRPFNTIQPLLNSLRVLRTCADTVKLER